MNSLKTSDWSQSWGTSCQYLKRWIPNLNMAAEVSNKGWICVTPNRVYIAAGPETEEAGKALANTALETWIKNQKQSNLEECKKLLAREWLEFHDRKHNTTWPEVASALGVSETISTKDLEAIAGY